jgi:hypothetical protein
MDKGPLLEMLADACGKKGKNGAFEFTEAEKASLLLSADGALFPIDEVTRVEVKDGYAIVRVSKDNLYLLDVGRIVGLKLQTRRGQAGFLP